MKRLLILFTVLATIFAGVWIWKLKTPENRPDSYKNGIEANYWWNAVGETEEVDTNWKLAEGIPRNYIPVPGNKDLYMIVDDDGFITAYVKRVKNLLDEWTWEPVNPDIPENYEAVPGLKDVYKVTYDDGSVKYFKYVRNKDDTYAFVEVDAKGNMIGVEKPKDGTIPENFERVDKNQYAVKNSQGITIAFYERVVDPTSEDGFTWEEITEEDLAQKTADAIASAGFNLETDITGLGDNTGGSRPYLDTSSLSGDSTSYVIPTIMPSQNVTASNNTGTFTFVQPQKETTIIEQIYVTAPPLDTSSYEQIQIQNPIGDNNTIANPIGDNNTIQKPENITGNISLEDGTTGKIVLGEDGRTMFIPDGGQGGITNVVISGNTGNTSEFISTIQGEVNNGGNNGGNKSTDLPTMPPSSFVDGGGFTGNSEFTDITGTSSDGNSYIDAVNQTQNGNLISRQTLNTRVQEGNDIVTYQEIIETITDSEGNVISSGSLGKKEISREPMGGTNVSSSVEATIGAEYDRILGLLKNSSGKFNPDTPKRLRELINNQRNESGKSSLHPPGGSDGIYLVALSRTAMMALTGSTSKDLPSYGSLMNMCSKYSVNVGTASESILSTGSTNAEAIFAMISSSSYDAIMSEKYTHVAIGIAEKSGTMYVCVIFY